MFYAVLIKVETELKSNNLVMLHNRTFFFEKKNKSKSKPNVSVQRKKLTLEKKKKNNNIDTFF